MIDRRNRAIPPGLGQNAHGASSQDSIHIPNRSLLYLERGYRRSIPCC